MTRNSNYLLKINPYIMSCNNCDKAQEGSTSAYFRWKNANIELRGCGQHLRQVIQALRDSPNQQTKWTHTNYELMISGTAGL